MKIVFIGAGYIGLVSGACLAELGWDVTCVDKDPEKIGLLKSHQGIPIYEPGLEEMVVRNVEAGRLRFSETLAGFVDGADIVFIAVGTPTALGSGRADLSYVYEAVDELADHLTSHKLIVIKSTVPVGTGELIVDKIRKKNPDAQFDICSNPEFLREGVAVSDFMAPDRIVVGVNNEASAATMKALYAPLIEQGVPFLVTDLRSSELTKYVANCFLAMKVTFINEVADLCEAASADIDFIAKGIGLDQRIGAKFLAPGPGYGGSCFPKDTLAFVQKAHELGARQRLIEEVVDLNNVRKYRMVRKIENACGGSVAGKRIGFLGLTFKANTSDMRESPSLEIIPRLLELGAHIIGFDPKGMPAARDLLPIGFAKEEEECAVGADCLVLLTEWPQFRDCDYAKFKDLMAAPNFVDLRNMLDPSSMRQLGYKYQAIGK